jgi:ribose transport system substrate-binding protein
MKTLACFFSSLLLLACSKPAPDIATAGGAAKASAPAHKVVNISLILGATGNEFAGEQRAGALAAAADLGSDVQLRIAGPAQIDPGKEVEIFQNEAATLPDAIIVAPMPPSLFAEPARKATAQGIPVSYLMTPPGNDVVDGLFVGQREYDVGRQVANIVADHIIANFPNTSPERITGRILTANCVQGMENLDDRMLGVRTALAERLPKVIVPADMNSANERGTTFSLWQQAVQANPSALAFIGACENDSISLAKIKEDDHRDFQMAVFDTPEAVRNSIKEGVISAAVPPSHYTSAYMAVWLVGDALLHGRAVPQGWLATPIRVIDRGNVAAFGAASLPPKNLGAFYHDDIEMLKSKALRELPPLAASRAPHTH